MDTAIKDLRFEEAYAELEALVRQLESGELALEDSVALYERGRLLTAHCQHLLEAAELRVTPVSDGES